MQPKMRGSYVFQWPHISCRKTHSNQVKQSRFLKESSVLVSQPLRLMHWVTVQLTTFAILFWFQPNIVLLRDRLCRAQGELSGGQEALMVPYERQPMLKGQAGPVAGQMQGAQAPAQQYYQQVSGFRQSGRDMVLRFWRVMHKEIFFYYYCLSFRSSGYITYRYWAPCGKSHWRCFSVSTDVSFTSHLGTSIKHFVK